MKNFFSKYTRPNTFHKMHKLPDYLFNFQKPEKLDTQIHIQQYKNGEYDLDKEERDIF